MGAIRARPRGRQGLTEMKVRVLIHVGLGEGHGWRKMRRNILAQ